MSLSLKENLIFENKKFLESKEKFPNEYYFQVDSLISNYSNAYNNKNYSRHKKAVFFLKTLSSFFRSNKHYDFSKNCSPSLKDLKNISLKLCDLLISDKEHFKNHNTIDSIEFDGFLKAFVLAEEDINKAATCLEFS